MQRAAVVYFSHTGTTANAAKEIHRITGGPLIALHRQPAYPANYADLVTTAQGERNAQHLPDLMPLTASLANVDTIFLGFPSWWAQPPMVIDRFLISTDLKGKTIVPFTTSISSTIDESMGTLNRLAREAGAKVATGLTASSADVTDKFMTPYK